MKLKLVLLGAIVCASASAGVIYQTGFEPLAYAAGGLSGQDNWTGSATPIVQTANVFSGTQAVRYDATGLSDLDMVIHSLTYDALTDPNKVVVGQIEVNISNLGTHSVWEALLFRGPGGVQVGQLVVAENGRPCMSIFFTTICSPSFMPFGVWNLYTFSMNFQTQQYTAFANGQLIGTMPFNQNFTSLSTVQFGLHHLAGTDSAFFDNLSVSSVPEPASWQILAIGLTCLAWRRKSLRRLTPNPNSAFAPRRGRKCALAQALVDKRQVLPDAEELTWATRCMIVCGFRGMRDQRSKPMAITITK